jgi:four helix bundle protein
MEKVDYVFDFEKLDVYQKAMAFLGSIFRLTRKLPREYQFSVADQPRRAGLSIVNNLAEGSGKLSGREKAQFYKTALNSTRECVPMLMLLSQEEQIPRGLHQELRHGRTRCEHAWTPYRELALIRMMVHYTLHNPHYTRVRHA